MNYHCIRCGRIDRTFNLKAKTENRWCAPCCLDCRSMVIKETRKDLTMWPADFYGGWIWSDEHEEWIPDGLLRDRAFERANYDDKWIIGLTSETED